MKTVKNEINGQKFELQKRVNLNSNCNYKLTQFNILNH